MSAFTGSLTITEIVPGKRWRLVDALVWEVGAKGSGVRIEVPAGFETDGTSIPAPLRVFLAVWGSYGRAACLHDYTYSILREGRLWHCDGSGGDYLHPAFDIDDARRWADQQFYEAMLACGTRPALAWVMWAAVRLFGGRAAAPGRAP